MHNITTIIQTFPYAVGIILYISVIAPFYGLNAALRRMVLIGLTLPHTSALGVIIGHWLNIPVYVTAPLVTISVILIIYLSFDKFYSIWWHCRVWASTTMEC